MEEVSIPFEQGDAFRQTKLLQSSYFRVSIPFEQGDVFRPLVVPNYSMIKESQSLSNSAMSFDHCLGDK